MDILHIVLNTLVIYSWAATMLYFFTKENEDVLIFFGLGIVGLLTLAAINIISKIKSFFKYRYHKYSIFEEISTGNKYKCKSKHSKDIDWLPEYKILKRYVTKKVYEDLYKNVPNLPKEVIRRSKINCDNCKYNTTEYCLRTNGIKCKHDEYDEILEFDKFEPKKII